MEGAHARVIVSILIMLLTEGLSQYPDVKLELAPASVFLQNGFVAIQWNTTNPKFDVLLGSSVAGGIFKNLSRYCHDDKSFAGGYGKNVFSVDSGIEYLSRSGLFVGKKISSSFSLK